MRTTPVVEQGALYVVGGGVYYEHLLHEARVRERRYVKLRIEKAGAFIPSGIWHFTQATHYHSPKQKLLKSMAKSI